MVTMSCLGRVDLTNELYKKKTVWYRHKISITITHLNMYVLLECFTALTIYSNRTVTVTMYCIQCSFNYEATIFTYALSKFEPKLLLHECYIIYVLTAMPHHSVNDVRWFQGPFTLSNYIAI